MIKLVLTAIVAVLVTLGALFGLNSAGVINVSQLFGGGGSDVLEDVIEDKMIEQGEVVIRDILVPINNGRRQGLLLLEISLYGDKTNLKSIENNSAKIKNTVLQAFSVKPESYFLDEKFFAILQKDLFKELTEVEEYKINDVLVVKAVYQ